MYLKGVSVTVLAQKGPEASITRKSERKASMDVKLLLIANGKHRHYTVIKSLSRLLRSRNTRHAHKQYFCPNCLQSFHSEGSRNKHYEYCKDNEAVRIEMPKPSSFIEFHDGQNQFKVPIQTLKQFSGQYMSPALIPTSHTPRRLIDISPLVFASSASLLMMRLKTH